MVSSIAPGAAGSLSADPRLNNARNPLTQAQANQQDAAKADRVDVGGAAAWASARQSVREGLGQVHQALAAGHEAQSMLAQAQALARNGGAQADLDALLQNYQQRLDAILGQNGGVAVGEAIAINAEPGAAPLAVQGADMRLKQNPQEGDVLQIAADARIDDASLNQALQRSFEKLQSAMDALFASARALEAHQGFLGAAELANAANIDLDAEGARLLALNVSQSLAGGGSIANAEPQAVLSLFKA